MTELPSLEIDCRLHAARPHSSYPYRAGCQGQQTCQTTSDLSLPTMSSSMRQCVVPPLSARSQSAAPSWSLTLGQGTSARTCVPVPQGLRTSWDTAANKTSPALLLTPSREPQHSLSSCQPQPRLNMARPLPKPPSMEPVTFPYFEMTRTKLLFICYLTAI
jgi:hypothetical protein